MNKKYKTLISNTAIFAVGNLLVKLIAFFLMPLYTSVLTTEQYGISELLNSSIEIVLPIFTLSIIEALYRFSIDKNADHSSLFANSLSIVVIGDIVVVFICVIIWILFDYQYSFEFGLLYCSTTLYKLTIQFARGLGHSKRYALYGVLNALILVLSNCILLVVLHGGIKAYLLSFAISHGVVGIIALFASGEYKFLKATKLNTPLLKTMIQYSLPGIPNMLSWWVNSVSDRYIILLFMGSGVAGLYTAASKLPAMINIVTSIFQQAWQFSTATEIDKKDNKSFFSNVFMAYSFTCLLVCTVLVALNKVVCAVLLKSDFYIAWKFVPLLLLAATFGCYSTYFGTFYNAMKNNKMLMVSTIVGAIVNLVLNFTLIPFLGGIGAAIATVVSYAIVLIIRVVDINKILSLDIPYKKWIVQMAVVTLYSLTATYVDSNIVCFFTIIPIVVIFIMNLDFIKDCYRLGIKRFSKFQK